MDKGSIVKVTLSVSGKVTGPDLKKTGRISKHYTGRPVIVDVPWWCRVAHDTDPLREREGTVYVWPISPVGNADQEPPAPRKARPVAEAAPIPPQSKLHLKPSLRRNARKAIHKAFQKGNVAQSGPKSAAATKGDKAKADANSRWDISEETVFSTVRITVKRLVMEDGFEIEAYSAWVSNYPEWRREQGPWPKDVRDKVLTRIRELEAKDRQDSLRRRTENALRQECLRGAAEAQRVASARRAEEAERAAAAEQEKRNVEASVFAARRKAIAQLVNPIDVVVTAIEETSQPLRLPTFVTSGEYPVWCNGEVIGHYGNYETSMVPRTSFPFTLVTRRITLSNGAALIIHSHDFRLWMKREEGKLKGAVLYSTKCPANLIDKAELTWDEAKLLEVGSVIGHEHRFQEIDQYVTEGTIFFSLERPTPWPRDLPVKSIDAPVYPRYLNGLKGKRLADLLESYDNEGRKRQVPTGPKLTKKQKDLYKICTGKMWEGDENCKDISLGANGDIIYHVIREGRPKRYVLESARVRAIVFFREDQYEEAVEFANGSKKRRDAWGHYPRIIHNEGWENELVQVLADPAKEAAFFASVAA